MNQVISSNYNLLLVEDDAELASLVQDYLTKNGFIVGIVGDGETAISEIIRQQPDMVILDVMLPSCNGMDVCKAVRSKYTGPIIMLTALDDDIDQMLGLELGADDYIIKPVQPRLLLTRIRTLLRRTKATDLKNQSLSITKRHTSHGLEINLSQRSICVDGHQIKLTTAEFELLLMLAQDAGRVVAREEIVQQLRGLNYDGLDRSMDRRISRLRKKLSCHNPQIEIIKTVRGKGYQLCIEVDLIKGNTRG